MIFAVAGCFVVAGVTLGLSGAGVLRRSRAFRRRAVRVRARVTDLRVLPPGREIRTRSPVVAFHTRGGLAVQAVTSQGAQPCPYRLGQLAPVWYDPRDPHMIEVEGMGDRTGAFLRGTFGGLLAAIGLVVGLFNL